MKQVKVYYLKHLFKQTSLCLLGSGDCAEKRLNLFTHLGLLIWGWIEAGALHLGIGSVYKARHSEGIKGNISLLSQPSLSQFWIELILPVFVYSSRDGLCICRQIKCVFCVLPLKNKIRWHIPYTAYGVKTNKQPVS